MHKHRDGVEKKQEKTNLSYLGGLIMKLISCSINRSKQSKIFPFSPLFSVTKNCSFSFLTEIETQGTRLIKWKGTKAAAVFCEKERERRESQIGFQESSIWVASFGFLKINKNRKNKNRKRKSKIEEIFYCKLKWKSDDGLLTNYPCCIYLTCQAWLRQLQWHVSICNWFT